MAGMPKSINGDHRLLRACGQSGPLGGGSLETKQKVIDQTCMSGKIMISSDDCVIAF